MINIRLHSVETQESDNKLLEQIKYVEDEVESARLSVTPRLRHHFLEEVHDVVHGKGLRVVCSWSIAGFAEHHD